MLVISRGCGKSLAIGDDITVTVLAINSNREVVLVIDSRAVKKTPQRLKKEIAWF